METNEAPEKVYISYEGYGVFGEDGSTERTKISQIEYTRTDAFIEKVCDWLRENIYNRVYKHGDDLSFPTAEFLKEFKTHMKGE